MKPLVTLIFVIGLLPSFAQDIAIQPTTEEEYNYLTKGYRVQIESGLDMKKGYTFDDLGQENKVGNYSFQFKALIREEKKQVAGILVVTKSAVSGKLYYFALPINNVDLLKRYWEDLSTWDLDVTRAYSYMLSVYLVDMTAGIEELEKQIKK